MLLLLYYDDYVDLLAPCFPTGVSAMDSDDIVADLTYDLTKHFGSFWLVVPLGRMVAMDAGDKGALIVSCVI